MTAMNDDIKTLRRIANWIEPDQREHSARKLREIADRLESSSNLNGFDVEKLPPILISCVAKLWPGSKGMFWERFIELMPERIQQLVEPVPLAPSGAVPRYEDALPGLEDDRGFVSYPKQIALMQAEIDAYRAAQPLAGQDVRAVTYTCKGKGGVYKRISTAIGAGTSRGAEIVIYEGDDGVWYFRTADDFADRMGIIK